MSTPNLPLPSLLLSGVAVNHDDAATPPPGRAVSDVPLPMPRSALEYLILIWLIRSTFIACELIGSCRVMRNRTWPFCRIRHDALVRSRLRNRLGRSDMPGRKKRREQKKGIGDRVLAASSHLSIHQRRRLWCMCRGSAHIPTLRTQHTDPGLLGRTVGTSGIPGLSPGRS